MQRMKVPSPSTVPAPSPCRSSWLGIEPRWDAHIGTLLLAPVGQRGRPWSGRLPHTLLLWFPHLCSQALKLP